MARSVQRRETSSAATAVLLALALVGVAAVGLVLRDRGATTVAAAAATPAVASQAAGPGLGTATPLAAWIGDTWISGVNGGGATGSIAARTSRALGYDWQLSSQPETGWATAGIPGVQGLNTAFPARVPAIVALKPRLVIVGGGANDVGNGASQDAVAAAVHATLTALRAGLGPTVPLVVIGPTWPSVTVPAAVLATSATIAGAAAAEHVAFIDPLAEHWLTTAAAPGYIKAGFLTVAGNTAFARLLVADLHGRHLLATGEPPG